MVAVAPALLDSLPAPSLTWLGEAQGWRRYRLESKRSAHRFQLELLDTLPDRIRLGGETFDVPGGEFEILGVPEQGLEFELHWAGPAPGSAARLMDQTIGLPKSIQAWADLAGTSWVPRHRGHRTFVSGAVSLGPGPSESGD
jgi:hypothetical protein